MNTPVSLSGLAKIISGVFRQQFGNARFWVIAEVAGLKISRGHCYLQLVEKDEAGITVCAEFRGIIWASQYNMLHNRFVQVTGKPLQVQQQVLCMVEVQYHERFGLSLVIHDLDPSYTLGKIEKERRLILQKLRDEGVFDLNRQLKFPEVPQRVAVISASDSKGYEDFITKLNANPFGYKFHTKLYESLLQGRLAANEITARIKTIEAETATEKFDVIVIVRGGGSASDLGTFDDYNLARAVALCTVPVITGIGHTTNQSITDQTAAKSCLTPTDVAVYLVEKIVLFESLINGIASAFDSASETLMEEQQLAVNGYATTLAYLVQEVFNTEQMDLQHAASTLRHGVLMELSGAATSLDRSLLSVSNASMRIMTQQKHQLVTSEQSLSHQWQRLKQQHEHQLEITDHRLKLLDPQQILRRGYSYTLLNGKAVTSSKQVEKGNRLTTIFADGSVDSIAEK